MGVFEFLKLQKSRKQIFGQQKESGVAPANQTKERAKTKSSWISPIFVNSGVFPWENKHETHIELLFRNAPAKSSWTDLSLVWFASATPERNKKKRDTAVFVVLCKRCLARVLPEDYCKEDPCNFPWGRELARSWPRVGQLLSNSVYKILLGRFRTVFLLARACTKSGRLEVDQELDMGWPTFDMNIPVLELQGSCLQRSSGNTQLAFSQRARARQKGNVGPLLKDQSGPECRVQNDFIGWVAGPLSERNVSKSVDK